MLLSLSRLLLRPFLSWIRSAYACPQAGSRTKAQSAKSRLREPGIALLLRPLKSDELSHPFASNHPTDEDLSAGTPGKANG